MRWEEGKRKEEVEDSQMDDGEPIQTVQSKENFGKWLKQRDNGTQKVSRSPTVESPAMDVETEMKETAKAKEGLLESKHATKQLSQEEIEGMVKEMELEE